MQIAGLVKNSFVDYPGKIAATIFTQGCDFDCYFCHNRALLPTMAGREDPEAVLAFLQKRTALLEGVVLTGGEPTLQGDLVPFLQRIKAMGYPIKLDTNGGHPAVLAALLQAGLLDYVAMDIKAPWEKYPAVACVDPAPVQQSLQLLRESGVEFEVRTTFLPELNADDILDIALQVRPVPRYALQEFRLPEAYPPQVAARLGRPRHDAEAFAAAARVAAACAGEVVVRR